MFGSKVMMVWVVAGKRPTAGQVPVPNLPQIAVDELRDAGSQKNLGPAPVAAVVGRPPGLA
jgi:hypothetical protein